MFCKEELSKWFLCPWAPRRSGHGPGWAAWVNMAMARGTGLNPEIFCSLFCNTSVPVWRLDAQTHASAYKFTCGWQQMPFFFAEVWQTWFLQGPFAQKVWAPSYPQIDWEDWYKVEYQSECSLPSRYVQIFGPVYSQCICILRRGSGEFIWTIPQEANIRVTGTCDEEATYRNVGSIVNTYNGSKYNSSSGFSFNT